MDAGQGESLALGLLAGIVAAGVGAGVWMGVTLAMNGAHIGYMALGVGALVGLAIRLAGHGRSMIFGIMGAVLTLLGCLGGDILTLAQQASTPEHDFYSTLTSMDLTQVVPNIFSKMDAIMYLIYGIGIFEGYKLSICK